MIIVIKENCTMLLKIQSLLFVKKSFIPVIQLLRSNSNRTCLARIGREKYLRMYPTRVVNYDGSTYMIRYHEPRQIIKLPIDVSKLNPEELEAHLNRKKGKQELHIEEDVEDNFDLNKYSHLWKK